MEGCLIAISRAPTLLTWFNMVRCGRNSAHAAGHAMEAKPKCWGDKAEVETPMKVSAEVPGAQVFVQHRAVNLGNAVDKSIQTRTKDGFHAIDRCSENGPATK